MKEIKDYLHLYLDCQVVKQYDVQIENPKEIFQLIGFEVDNAIIFHPSKGSPEWISKTKVKPILRPLSDMTEEEANDLQCWHDWSRERLLGIVFAPENFIKALKYGFDLFELIPEGLAIDKTTLNKPVKQK